MHHSRIPKLQRQPEAASARGAVYLARGSHSVVNDGLREHTSDAKAVLPKLT